MFDQAETLSSGAILPDALPAFSFQVLLRQVMAASLFYETMTSICLSIGTGTTVWNV